MISHDMANRLDTKGGKEKIEGNTLFRRDEDSATEIGEIVSVRDALSLRHLLSTRSCARI